MKRGIISLLLAILILSACHDKEGVYDPNYNPELDVSVPDGFDWSTTQTVTVNVEVNDEYNGKRLYYVRVYIMNPKDGGLPIVNEKSNMDIPFSEEIVIPVSVKTLYIEQCFMKANATEVVIMKEVTIDSDVVGYSFKGVAKSAKISRAVSRDKDEEKTIEVSEGSTYTVNKSPCKNCSFIIKSGGTLRFEGDVRLQDCKIKNDGSLIAEGSLTLQKTNLENGRSVHIAGSLDVDKDSKLEMDDSSCTIVEGNVVLKSDAEMEESAYFSCVDLSLLSEEVGISMETGAWLRVTGKLQASAKCEIEWDDDDEDDYILNTKWVALAQINEIKNNGKGNLSVDKEILVECKSIGQADIDEGSLVEDASKYITIVPTACNDGGINVDTPSYLGADYTFAMEDQYPEKGDYDMNDIVVLISKESSYSSLHKHATIKGTLIAAGANMSIIPYVGINKKNRNESKALFYDDSGNIINVYEAFKGPGNTCPVNTNFEGGVTLSTVAFKVELDNVQENLNIKSLDFYIRVNGHEIDCDTRNADNDIFGIIIPGKFRYPIEGSNISTCYGVPFKKWIESDKQDYKDWFNSNSAKDVISF